MFGAAANKKTKTARVGAGVYVLRLHGRDGRGNHYYVGKSTNVPHRIATHQRASDDSAAWVKYHNGVQAVEEPSTPRGEDVNNWEMRETIARMIRHGIDNVRGWEWTLCRPFERDYVSFRVAACGVLDCCRACGQPGHYVLQCPGNSIEPWLQHCDEAISADPKPPGRSTEESDVFGTLGDALY